MFFFVSGTWTPCKNKSNTTFNTGTIDLHPTNTRHYNGRRFTIRLHFHSIVFHIEFNLVVATLLHVRFFVLGIYHFGDYVCGNDDFIVLFPSVCGRLSLVVAFVFNFRFHRDLSIFVLLSLFLYEIANWRCRVRVFVFRLYAYYGVSV